MIISMKASTLLVLSLGTGLVSIVTYFTTKKKQIERIIEQLEFSVSGISNFGISFKHVAMDLHIEILNPTGTDLYINTGFVEAKILRAYHKQTRKLLAFTNLNTNKINVPSGSRYKLTPIHVKIPLLTGGKLLFSQLTSKPMIQKDLIKELVFELEIEAFGKRRVIEL